MLIVFGLHQAANSGFLPSQRLPCNPEARLSSSLLPGCSGGSGRPHSSRLAAFSRSQLLQHCWPQWPALASSTTSDLELEQLLFSVKGAALRILGYATTPRIRGAGTLIFRSPSFVLKILLRLELRGRMSNGVGNAVVIMRSLGKAAPVHLRHQVSVS